MAEWQTYNIRKGCKRRWLCSCRRKGNYYYHHLKKKEKVNVIYHVLDGNRWRENAFEEYRYYRMQ